MTNVAERAEEHAKYIEEVGLVKKYQSHTRDRNQIEAMIREIVRRKMYDTWDMGILSDVVTAVEQTSAISVARALGVTRQTVYRWVREAERITLPSLKVEKLADHWEAIVDEEMGSA
jgi:K+/H+ antiporter YhaU regulatory subunit KhtT